LATPFGYAGAYTDPTGLIYLIHRYYDPATGQFLSVDPYLNSTHEPYIYADGNPVTNTDPTGQVIPVGGGRGYIPTIRCNQKKISREPDGVLSLAYYCPGHTIPWGYKIGPGPKRQMAVDLVYEYGMLYTINYGSYHHNHYHLEPSWYTFHGNMNPVHFGNIVDFIDELSYITYRGAGAILVYGEVEAVR
jgi:RHS repeat-associated protein